MSDHTIRLPAGFKESDLARMAEAVGCTVRSERTKEGVRYEFRPVGAVAMKNGGGE